MPYRTLVDVAELAPLIDAGEVALFDCRFDLADPAAGRRRYEGGHLPGATYLDLDADLSSRSTGRDGRHPLPDRSALAATLAAAGLRAGRQAVAYDDAGGAFAARLWWLLRWLGHEDVAVLDGGIQAWRAAWPALEKGGPPAPGPGDFRATSEPAMPIVDAATIVASLDDRRLLVVDARSPERFRGEPNPLDPVAGHIPGARNRFFRDNLGPEGRFKPAVALARDYADLIGNTPLDRVVVQCGSGVTAAHDLLAMEHAGLAGARLYPGSWSEWTADSARPVERGG